MNLAEAIRAEREAHPMEQHNRYKVLCEHCGGETIITEKIYQWQQRVRCSQCSKLTLIDTDSEMVEGKR